jgi:hypothetical protein
VSALSLSLSLSLLQRARSPPRPLSAGCHCRRGRRRWATASPTSARERGGARSQSHICKRRVHAVSVAVSVSVGCVLAGGSPTLCECTQCPMGALPGGHRPSSATMACPQPLPLVCVGRCVALLPAPPLPRPTPTGSRPCSGGWARSSSPGQAAARRRWRGGRRRRPVRRPAVPR